VTQPGTLFVCVCKAQMWGQCRAGTAASGVGRWFSQRAGHRARWGSVVEIRGWNPRHTSADTQLNRPDTSCPVQQAHPARPRVDERHCLGLFAGRRCGCEPHDPSRRLSSFVWRILQTTTVCLSKAAICWNGNCKCSFAVFFSSAINSRPDSHSRTVNSC
jgi:hypothetical protein